MIDGGRLSFLGPAVTWPAVMCTADSTVEGEVLPCVIVAAGAGLGVFDAHAEAWTVAPPAPRRMGRPAASGPPRRSPA